MAIPIRKPSEIDALAKASHLVALALQEVKSYIKPGITPLELDKIAEDFIRSNNGRPSFKGLYDFPNSILTSVNEVIIHGIPNDTPLAEGDIIGIDLGVEMDGWYGDAAMTFAVGTISEQSQSLIDCARATLYEAIAAIEAGMRFKELSAVLEHGIVSRGFVPLKGYCGHGIGRKPHEEPSILNYVEGKPNQGPKIKDGMVFCLEPMICQKSGESKLLDDKWSVVSTDGLSGSHFEHTVAVIGGKAEILSI